MAIASDCDLRRLEWDLDEGYLIEGCIGDGSCLYHAMCKAFSIPYQESYIEKLGGRWRRRFVSDMRQTVAERLLSNRRLRMRVRRALPGLFVCDEEDAVFEGLYRELEGGGNLYYYHAHIFAEFIYMDSGVKIGFLIVDGGSNEISNALRSSPSREMEVYGIIYYERGHYELIVKEDSSCHHRSDIIVERLLMRD